jgi:hypothetical protein
MDQAYLNKKAILLANTEGEKNTKSELCQQWGWRQFKDKKNVWSSLLFLIHGFMIY